MSNCSISVVSLHLLLWNDKICGKNWKSPSPTRFSENNSWTLRPPGGQNVKSITSHFSLNISSLCIQMAQQKNACRYSFIPSHDDFCHSFYICCSWSELFLYSWQNFISTSTVNMLRGMLHLIQNKIMLYRSLRSRPSNTWCSTIHYITIITHKIVFVHKELLNRAAHLPHWSKLLKRKKKVWQWCYNPIINT